MSVELSVRVEGAELVRKGLQNLDRDIPRIGANQIHTAMKRARKKIITYPPPIPTSRYKRTGTYRRAFRIRRNPRSGLRKSAGYTLQGRAVQKGRDYTRYVGGDAFGHRQAEIHAGRWNLIRDEVEAEVEKLPRGVEKHIKMATRRRRLA